MHAFVSAGDEHAQAPVDVYTDSLSLYNTLDADGLVQPKEVGAAVHELRELYRGGAVASITWLRAPGQLTDALTKPGRNTPLQHALRVGSYAVRLAAGDFMTKLPVVPSRARRHHGRAPAAGSSGAAALDGPAVADVNSDASFSTDSSVVSASSQDVDVCEFGCCGVRGVPSDRYGQGALRGRDPLLGHDPGVPLRR